jgi:hypothetical protein
MSKQKRIGIISRPPSGLHIEMEKALRGSTDHQVSETRARARELALHALSAASITEGLELAVKAVVLDPRCTDALVILSDVFEDLDEYIEAMYLIVMRAAEDLGPEFFQRERGHFREAIETRSYMRARMQLAHALDEATMFNQAIAEFEGLLDLNGNDNLGARLPLLSLSLKTDKLEMASSLLTRFADDITPQFAWLRVLLAFLTHDSATAESEFQRAREHSKLVEGYLTGRKQLPDKLPETATADSVAEAVICASEIHGAWDAHPDAVRWLKAHAVRKAGRAKR